MKFVDEVIISIQSGDGGRGCVGFRREKHVPRGGPDGGDGGKGGDVVFIASFRKRTLYDFHFRRQFRAENGKHGQGKQMTGRNGDDLIIEIPTGTLIVDAESGKILKDLVKPGDTFVAARGGRGGQGNARFKTSTNRTPRFAQPGESGQAFTLKLELKLIADVGLVGLPNAGKSTLISAITSAKPKIGDYPFTTLTPNLGVAKLPREEPFIVADIPGLIEGAHEGAGLGIRFLRHIERTRLLVHLLDASTIDPGKPLKDYRTINAELSEYSGRLADKPRIVVLNKMDMPESQSRAEIFEAALKTHQVLRISAKTGNGIQQLLTRIMQQMDSGNESAQGKLF